VRAAILEAPYRVVERSIAEPQLADDDEVLIEIEHASICGSDLALFNGSRPVALPLVLGHEAIGRVVDAGRSQHSPGTLVVVEPNIPCRTCSVCLRGRGNICPRKRSLGLNSPGLFAERVAVPAEFAHPLPPEIISPDAVCIEPLAVAVHAFGLGQAAAGDAVAIIGCGSEGLLLVQVAVTMGVRVLAVDVREERLHVARQLGATRTLCIPADEPVDVTAGRIAAEWSPPIVFEAAGAASSLDLALQAVAPGGRVVALGLGTTPVPLVPLQFVRRGLTLVGSLIYDHPADFKAAIELVRTGRVEPHLIMTGMVLGLEQVARAFEMAASGLSGKILIQVSRTPDYTQTDSGH
jgi:L-iditol 2-dehydrogenase